MSDMQPSRPDDQSDVLAFLAKTSSYDPPPGEVSRIDTHGAIVFLAGAFAFKVKRSVKLPYLDFSTLEKRRAVCAREVEINRKTAPGLYIGMEPVVRRRSGELSIGGEGEPVEWAVKMRRFDQDNLLDHMAKQGSLPSVIMPALARTIAALHASARAKRDFDTVAAMQGIVASIADALAEAAPDLPAAQTVQFCDQLKTLLARDAGLLEERTRRGFVRRCHGDVHLRNIVLIDGQPTLFDAIEFDEVIATIDILYDLAFLLMDLWHRGLKTHANLVFNAYMRLPAPGPARVSLNGLRLLPFFMATRASVRAMVAHDLLGVAKGAARETALAEMKSFFRLAVSLLDVQPPRLVAVGGLSGTGKSTLAAAIAPELGNAPGALVVRSDVERKRLAGLAETERLGAQYYTAAATGRVYAALCAKAEAALRAGHTVVLDAVFARQVQRERVKHLAKRLGVPFTGVWLEASAREMIDRVDAREEDASDADVGVVREQLGYDLGAMTWSRVNAAGRPEDVQGRAARILVR